MCHGGAFVYFFLFHNTSPQVLRGNLRNVRRIRRNAMSSAENLIKDAVKAARKLKKEGEHVNAQSYLCATHNLVRDQWGMQYESMWRNLTKDL